MRFVDFLATYALDRVEFGDSTKYLYEGIYEVFEGKTIDLTPIDNLVIKIFDPDLIEESGIITEEIKERIENGELPQVLSESTLLQKIGTFLGGKATAEDTAFFKKYMAQMSGMQDYQKEQWLKQMLKTNTGASGGLWTKINKAFGNYTNGGLSTKFANASEKAAKLAASDPTNALASMKSVLSHGLSWVFNPANFNIVLGTAGGVLALKLILRILKQRRIKKEQRKAAEAQVALLTQQRSVKTEELDDETKALCENIDIAETLINTNKQANRVIYGITDRNSSILNY